jgi:DNA-binding NarL/FixJ family response regulator
MNAADLPFRMTRQYARDLVNELTPRESQIVELIALGMERREIVKRLPMKPKTLETHIFHITQKWKMPVHGWGRVWFCALCGE